MIGRMPNQPDVSVVIARKLASRPQSTIPQPISCGYGTSCLTRLSTDESWSPKYNEGLRRTTRSAPSRNGARNRIPRPMRIVERGDVTKVPFPYTRCTTRQSQDVVAVWSANSSSAGS